MCMCSRTEAHACPLFTAAAATCSRCSSSQGAARRWRPQRPRPAATSAPRPSPRSSDSAPSGASTTRRPPTSRTEAGEGGGGAGQRSHDQHRPSWTLEQAGREEGAASNPCQGQSRAGWSGALWAETRSRSERTPSRTSTRLVCVERKVSRAVVVQMPDMARSRGMQVVMDSSSDRERESRHQRRPDAMVLGLACSSPSLCIHRCSLMLYMRRSTGAAGYRAGPSWSC